LRKPSVAIPGRRTGRGRRSVSLVGHGCATDMALTIPIVSFDEPCGSRELEERIGGDVVAIRGSAVARSCAQNSAFALAAIEPRVGKPERHAWSVRTLDVELGIVVEQSE